MQYTNFLKTCGLFTIGFIIFSTAINGEGGKENKNVKVLRLLPASAQITVNYPLETGDYAESIDETSLGFSVSRVRRITGDTLLPAPQIRLIEVISAPAYLQQLKEEVRYISRKSNGDIYIWYDNSEKPLYLFSGEVGQFYAAHYPGRTWYITGKMEVEVNGDTVNAVEFELVPEGSLARRRELIADKYGLVSSVEFDGGGSRYDGYFWGGIFGRQTSGTLIAGKSNVEWDKFLANEEGNFRKYRYNVPPGINLTVFDRVLGDTLMPDFSRYAVIKERSFDGSSIQATRYERSAENGYILQYNSRPDTLVKLSILVGDTLPSFPQVTQNAGWRVNKKYMDLVPVIELVSVGAAPVKIRRYGYGLGKLYYLHLGVRLEEFEGGVINGTAYGDTVTITSIVETAAEVTNKPELQIYPNPANNTSVIRFRQEQAGDARLRIYDITGAVVHEVVYSSLPVGEHTYRFTGTELASGMYICELLSGRNFVRTKLLLLK